MRTEAEVREALIHLKEAQAGLTAIEAIEAVSLPGGIKGSIRRLTEVIDAFEWMLGEGDSRFAIMIGKMAGNGTVEAAKLDERRRADAQS